MAITLSEIRFDIERSVKDSIENEDVVNWCNDAQTELLMVIDLPDSLTIPINTYDLAYTVSMDAKRINRIWLQSERDAGMDRDIAKPYRIYNGEIIFETRFDRDDTLQIDFYRHLTYFEDITDVIDVEDRYKTLYTSYGIAQYYDNPQVIDRLGDNRANRQYEKHYGRHLTIREQIASQYVMQAQPSTIKESW